MTSAKIIQTRRETCHLTTGFHQIAVELSQRGLLTASRIRNINLAISIATIIGDNLNEDAFVDDEFWRLLEPHLQALRQTHLHLRQILNPGFYDKGDNL